MNIARELGSLISSLLAPQASYRVTASEKSLLDRSRTEARNNTGQGETKTTRNGDRVTLSNASLSLQKRSQNRTPSSDSSFEAASPQTSELLALPYLPNATDSADLQQENSSAASGMTRNEALADSPATRQLVRNTYGNVDHTTATPTPTSISFHA